MLARLLSGLHGGAKVDRIGDLLAGSLEDDVSGLEALLGREPVGVDIGDDNALAPGLRRNRKAEPGYGGAPLLGALGSDAGLALVRQVAEHDADGFLLTFSHDGQLHRSGGRQGADRSRDLAGVADLLAVDGDDHIAGLDPGLDGGTVRLRLGDQRAACGLETEILGDARRDLLNLHADPTAGHLAL